MTLSTVNSYLVVSIHAVYTYRERERQYSHMECDNEYKSLVITKLHIGKPSWVSIRCLTVQCWVLCMWNPDGFHWYPFLVGYSATGHGGPHWLTQLFKCIEATNYELTFVWNSRCLMQKILYIDPFNIKHPSRNHGLVMFGTGFTWIYRYIFGTV